MACSTCRISKTAPINTKENRNLFIQGKNNALLPNSHELGKQRYLNISEFNRNHSLKKEKVIKIKIQEPQ